MDDQLAVALRQRLDELGLTLEESLSLADLPQNELMPVNLSHEYGVAEFGVGFTAALTVSSLDWVIPHLESSEKVLLLGCRITERSAAMLRHMGINYLDTAGNTFIRFNGVHIDIRGRRSQNVRAAGSTKQTRGGLNLFSTKRSQVIFVLLSWPELLNRSIREIARIAGVALGSTQETLELLTRFGFLENNRRQLVKSKRSLLIDQWAAAFPTGLGAEGKALHLSGNWRNLYALDSPVYISGDAAVPELLKPETAVFYAEEISSELIRANRWRRDDSRPNILLRKQFWEDPYTEAETGLRSAPWLLIYADLLASNDSRQREAAKQLREQQHD